MRIGHGVSLSLPSKCSYRRTGATAPLDSLELGGGQSIHDPGRDSARSVLCGISLRVVAEPRGANRVGVSNQILRDSSSYATAASLAASKFGGRPAPSRLNSAASKRSISRAAAPVGAWSASRTATGWLARPAVLDDNVQNESVPPDFVDALLARHTARHVVLRAERQPAHAPVEPYKKRRLKGREKDEARFDLFVSNQPHQPDETPTWQKHGVLINRAGTDDVGRERVVRIVLEYGYDSARADYSLHFGNEDRPSGRRYVMYDGNRDGRVKRTRLIGKGSAFVHIVMRPWISSPSEV
jgi:hypothetical protein